MKKKLILIPLLALVLMLSMTMPVLAWDNEDPCVADNEDFIWGIGWDSATAEDYYGGQSWSYFETPNDDYNLYRDDVTDTGNLDRVNGMYTRTPDAIDLSDSLYFDMDGGLWYMYDESPDTWYWATAPRGYDDPKREKDPNRFSVIMPFGQDQGRYVNEDTDILRYGIEVTGDYDDTGYMLVIPEGCGIERPSGDRLHSLYLKDIDGDVLTFTTGKGDVEFSEPCVLYMAPGEVTKDEWGKIVADEWVEAGSFTSIVDGEATLE